MCKSVGMQKYKLPQKRRHTLLKNNAIYLHAALGVGTKNGEAKIIPTITCTHSLKHIQ